MTEDTLLAISVFTPLLLSVDTQHFRSPIMLVVLVISTDLIYLKP